MCRPEEIAAIRRLAIGTPRLASVCTGAFLLAEAGLLDGRRATTHWSCVRDLRQRFPAVTVEGDRIFVADGPVWTSVGVTAGIDLALALIETDHGSDLVRSVARELVVYYRCPGGQSQFSAMSELEPASDRMWLALAFAREHLAEPLTVERLADAESPPVRTCFPPGNRRNACQGRRAAPGGSGSTTPAEWWRARRVHRARRWF